MGKTFSLDRSHLNTKDKRPERPKIPALQITSTSTRGSDDVLRSRSMGSAALHNGVPHLEDQSKMRISQSTSALSKMKPFKKQAKESRKRRRRGFSLSIIDLCGSSSSTFDSDDDESESTADTMELQSNALNTGEDEWSTRISSISSTSSISSIASPCSDNSNNSMHTDIDAICQALKAVDQRLPPPPILPRRMSSYRIEDSRDLIYEYYSGGNFGRSTGIDLACEHDYQQRQHFLLKRVWGSVYQAKIQDPELIIHWMCGSGQWEIDMSREFPSAHIVGIDYKTIPLAHVFHAPSVDYIELKAKPYSTGIHGLEKFKENSVDFLVLRDTWFLGVKNCQWSDVLGQVYKILKPGGWVEIYYQDIPLNTGGPHMRQMEEWAAICRRMFRISQNELEKMGGELSNEGFTNVSTQSVEVPVGEWASTPVLKETGYYIKDLKRRRLKLRSPWIKYANKISDRRFNQTLEKALEDCERYRAHATWICYDAQKPLS